MKILYGVQATGNGHIARARAMLPALQAADIAVDFLFSGAPRETLFDMECFGAARFFAGFTYRIADGKLDQITTVRELRPLQFVRDVRALNVDDYDMVLNDFEPVSAWAAKWRKVPSVGLSNQFALTAPLEAFRPPWLNRLLLRHFAPCDIALGLHWYRLHDAVLPPLTERLPESAHRRGDFILVYLPAENPTVILHWLARFPEQIFHVYARVEEAQAIDNIRLFPLARAAFLHDLAACDGVLCNSGFGVCTEAMQLGKKILTRPLFGQFEQQANAAILKQYRRATVLHHWDDDTMRDWLAADGFAPLHFPDVAQAVAQWLRQGCRESPQALSAALWEEMRRLNE
ncbi:MAG: glycosyltransferase family protein [Neisseria sp.]|nr:glycosyltransferase family protein [Neisseria sp.]